VGDLLGGRDVKGIQSHTTLLKIESNKRTKEDRMPPAIAEWAVTERRSLCDCKYSSVEFVQMIMDNLSNLGCDDNPVGSTWAWAWVNKRDLAEVGTCRRN